jgi:pyrimidine deaminase RibD-like protein
MELVTNEWHEKSSQTLCEMVIALRSLLTDSCTREEIQGLMVDNHILDTIITLIEESVVSAWNFVVLSVLENCSHYSSDTPCYQCTELIALRYRS